MDCMFFRRFAWATLLTLLLLSSSLSAAENAPPTTLPVTPETQFEKLAEQVKPGDAVLLQGGTYEQAQRIIFSGTADAPVVVRPAEGEEVVVRNTTWTLDGARHVVIEGLTFRDCAPALSFTNGASNNAVRNCQFIDCPPRAAEKLTSRTPWARALWVGGESHDGLIEGNVFERPYEGYYMVNEGLNVGEGCRGWTIRGNRISGYMYGLQLGVGARGGPPGYATVEGNEIFDCNQGLHIKTSDNVLRGNLIRDMNFGWRGYGTGIYLRSGPRTVVENNRVERGQWAGIRVLGRDQLVRNNVVVDTPVGICLTHHSYGRAGNSNWIVHNTVVGARLPLWVEQEAQAFVYNNVFASPSRGPGGPGIFASGMDIENPLASWNERMFKRMAGRHNEPAQVFADFNLFHPFDLPGAPLSIQARADDEDRPAISPDWWTANNVQGDPLFADAENGDYRLAPDSPARGAGRFLPNAAFDIAGTPRPERPDMGAFQSDE